MKKLYTIVIGSLLLGAGTVLAVTAALPSRVEIQEKVYNSSNTEVHELESEIKTMEAELGLLQTEADEAFCLLVDLKRADGEKINEKESVLRYNSTCHTGSFQ